MRADLVEGWLFDLKVLISLRLFIIIMNMLTDVMNHHKIME